jgi:DNA-binding GntR family transcriptional regulator
MNVQSTPDNHRAPRAGSSGDAESVVDRAYTLVKAMLVSYEIKPGERVNEGELARILGLSRTPLREALNRLIAENLLRFTPGKGFYCRPLDVHETFQLYELRKAIETTSVRLAVLRATDAEIVELDNFLERTSPEVVGYTTAQRVDFDETFHMSVIAMAKNREMARVLANINDRIRFIRLIDMNRTEIHTTQNEHRRILEAIRTRNEFACIELLEKHIDRRLDQIAADLKEGYAQIYLTNAAPQTP